MIAEIKAYNESNVVLVKDSSRVELATYGIQGPKGYSLLSGEGEPLSFLGNNQDLYIDTLSSFVYKKSNQEWEYQTYLRAQQKKIIITNENIESKGLILHPIPNNSDSVTLEFLTGGGQENGVEFGVLEGVLYWDKERLPGGLEGFIEEGDIIIVRY